MIAKNQVKRYCREDISLIENYEEAVNSSEPYVCHHRYELNDGIVLSQNDLKNMGLYYNRPASELIFMKRLDHKRLHTIGMVHPMYGKQHTRFAKIKIGESKLGEKNPKARKVFQIDRITKRLIKVWNCIAEAERHIKKFGISDCCHQKQNTCGGFCWCYPEDYENLYCAKRAIS